MSSHREVRCPQPAILILILNWCQLSYSTNYVGGGEKHGGTFLFPGRRSAHHHSEQEFILLGPRRLNVDKECQLVPKPKLEEAVSLASTSPAWITFLKPWGCHVLNRCKVRKGSLTFKVSLCRCQVLCSLQTTLPTS